MTKPFREQLLELLADGDWHGAAELAGPVRSSSSVEVFVRVLRAEGHRIDERDAGGAVSYRLPDPRQR